MRVCERVRAKIPCYWGQHLPGGVVPFAAAAADVDAGVEIIERQDPQLRVLTLHSHRSALVALWNKTVWVRVRGMRAEPEHSVIHRVLSATATKHRAVCVCVSQVCVQNQSCVFCCCTSTQVLQNTELSVGL